MNNKTGTVRRSKTLAIFDLDNTLTDTLLFWCAATGKGIESLARIFGVPEGDIISGVHRAPSQYRFADFGKLMDWLDEKGYLPQPADAEDRINVKGIRWALRHEWFRQQKTMTVFYDGALEAIKSMKQANTDVVIHTDAEASSMIRRFWLLAHNARRQGLVKDEHDVLALIDHFYCQPSIEDDQAILRDVDLSFVLKMKQKTTIWRDGIRKPLTDHTGIILDDFGVKPEDAVMVGDTEKDGGCARPLGVDFVWFRGGAQADAQTIARARQISVSGFTYGDAAIEAAFTPQNAPTHIAEKNLSEMAGMFEFKAGKGFREPPIQNAQTEAACPDMGAPPAEENHPAHRLSSLFRIRRHKSPLGPPTHLPPKPPKL